MEAGQPEAGEVAKVRRVQGPQLSIPGDGAGGNGEIQFPSARAAHCLVQACGQGRFLRAEGQGRFRGKEGLLGGQFLPQAGAAQPLVE